MKEIAFTFERDGESGWFVAHWNAPRGRGGITTQGKSLRESLALRQRSRAGSRVKLPRDVSGSEAVRALKRLGFVFVRQVGSHIRLSKGSVHITSESQSDSAKDAANSAQASRCEH